MASESVDVLIEGGKATAAPPLGPALGPLGVNIGQVVAEINKKTSEFKGMQVPVKVVVDKDSKEFTITVGTPPASALIKKEAKVDKGAGNPLAEKVADLKIEQIIKISKMKADNLLGKDNFSRVKEICGTCDSMGVLVEGKPARETIADINNGQFKDKIESGKTELSAEELKELAEEKKKLQEEIAKKKDALMATGKAILEQFKDKERAIIKAKMVEAKLPVQIINELLPTEEKKEPAKEEAPAKPAAKK